MSLTCKTIPLRDFLCAYNFAASAQWESVDYRNAPTDHIRICFFLNHTETWIELGVNENYGSAHKMAVFEYTLNQQILDMFVDAFEIDRENNTLIVHLVDSDCAED